MSKRISIDLTEEEYDAIVYSLACQAGVHPCPTTEPVGFDYVKLYVRIAQVKDQHDFFHRMMDKMKGWGSDVE